MKLVFIMSALGLAAVILLLTPRRADAHCNTMNGPTVKDNEIAHERQTRILFRRRKK